MYYPHYQQNNGNEQQYLMVKETVKMALNDFEQLHPDQQQRLLRELVQDKNLEELLRRVQLPFAQW